MKVTQLLQSQAYDYLKDMILKDKLEHGVIYSQKKVADELGISKTPLRDAVLRLEQERYIDVYPSKGFVIHEMMEEDIRETYQIRDAIETYCLRQLVADQSSERAGECISELKSKLEVQTGIIKTTMSNEEFARKDYEFHRTLVEYPGNRAMLHLYKDYMHRIFRQTVLSFTISGRMEDTLEEHKKIVELIEAGDRMELETLLEKHLQVAERINLDLLGGRQTAGQQWNRKDTK